MKPMPKQGETIVEGSTKFVVKTVHPAGRYTQVKADNLSIAGNYIARYYEAH